MFSIRKTWPLLIAGVMIGCTKTNVVHPSPLNRTPIAVDQAMILREWQQSTASYPDGATVAGPTDFNYDPKPGQPEWHYYYADSGTWALNMVLLLYYGWATPQWTAVIYPGEVVQTTYTGQPPLPPQTTAAYVPRGIRPPQVVVATRPMTMPATTTMTTARTAPTTRPVTTRTIP